MVELIALDFEFCKTSEQDVTLVCCAAKGNNSAKTDLFWLYNDSTSQAKLKRYLLVNKTAVFISYAAEAEARSFLALGLNPLEFTWVDLYLEYRMLLNHNNTYSYGNQLIKNKIVETRAPKLYEDREISDLVNNSKPEYNLHAAIFKLLGVRLDKDHKTTMRDLIISAPENFTKEEQEAILTYCAEDVEYLLPLYRKQKEIITKLRKEYPKEERYKRGEYSIRTAHMVRLGYPINLTATRKFANNVPKIQAQCAKDINSLLPNIHPFTIDMGGVHLEQKKVQEYIASQPYGAKWPRTDKGFISLAKESFEKYCGSKHTYGANLPDQMLRYMKLKQSLNGFLPTAKGKKSFWDYVGSDGRVRPHFGIFGSQSSRSQPSSTGFIFLKSAWMRFLVAPSKGRAIVGVDYSSQEFLISALLSGDKAMKEAYASGDVYLAFAKKARAVPQDATKKTHKFERDVFKAIVLGLSYDLGAASMALKITADTGRQYTEKQAQDLIDSFYKVFPQFAAWKKEIQKTYFGYWDVETRKEITGQGFLKLQDGWTMFGDNPNFRSIGNFPVQGTGAIIMRKAVEYAQEAGLQVIFTLHDALYVEYSAYDFSIVDKLMDAMCRAFDFYFPNSGIRVEADSWSDSYSHDVYIKTPAGSKVLLQRRHIDPRSIEDTVKFREYLDIPIEEVLL